MNYKKYFAVILAIFLLPVLFGCSRDKNNDYGVSDVKNDNSIIDDQTWLAIQEENPDYIRIVISDDIVCYQVGHFGLSSIPLFEIISTEASHVDDGKLAVTTLSCELYDTKFEFYILDENGKFLGAGGNRGYTPYTYSLTESPFETPSYATPFSYYFSKYFAGIECSSTEYKSILGDPFGRKTYEFIIEPKSYDDYAAVRESVELVRQSMNNTLGDNVKVVVKAFANTGDEIKVETPNPELEK